MFFNFLKTRWPLFVVILVFVLFKFPHLQSPFYWDESWPYASGIYKMYQNGPSLIPGAIDGELSRGHPLFFHFSGALWMKLFGTSIFSLHCFSLTISVSFLFVIYEVALHFIDWKAAFFAVTLVAFQQIFFVQSAFVLLEVLLAFLVFISIYFYVSKRYILAAISLSCLFYTKESGLVLGMILGMDALINMFRKENNFYNRLMPIASLLFPLLTIILFFLMQKRISGWYVLPLYSNGFEQEWGGFYDKFRACSKVVFRDDYRRYYFVFFLFIVISVAVLQKKLSLLAPVISAVFIFLICSDRFHSLINSMVLVALVMISLIWVTVALNRVFIQNQIELQKILLISIIFSACFFVFTSINLFFIDRYLLCVLIPVLFVSAVYLYFYLQRLHIAFFITSLIIVTCIQLYSIKNFQNLGDNQMGAFDGAIVHQKVVDFIESTQPKSTPIAAGGFLHRIHLTDANTRFLKSNDTFITVTWDILPQTKLVIFDNIEYDMRYEKIKIDINWQMQKRIEKGTAWAEIYAKKN